MISRVQAELTDEIIDRIAATVAAWRGEGGKRRVAELRRTSPATAAA
jgi:hypothetical protein